MGISKSIKNIFGKTKKKKDEVAIGGVTTGGVATHSDAVKSPKTKPKNRNRVRLSKNMQFMWQNMWQIFYCLASFLWHFTVFLIKIFPKNFWNFQFNRIFILFEFLRKSLRKDFSGNRLRKMGFSGNQM